MKILRFTYGLLAAAALSLASCNVNDMPEFDDADAFLAFTSSSAKVSETAGSIQIPVMLTSRAGLSGTVTIEVDAEKSTAAEGKDFTIDNKTLTFDAANPVQKFTVSVKDNDEFTGNRTVKLKLTNTSLNLGAAKECTLTIEDDEHPLAFILGTYHASADSYFSNRGHYDWDITVARDDDDINKVWIGNLDPFFFANGFMAPEENNFYGFVSDDKTQILVPVDQEVGYKTEVLAGFDNPDPDEGSRLETGSNIIVEIKDGGAKLVIPNAWGITGWYNLFYGGVEFVKK
jgi:hypothetical protein